MKKLLDKLVDKLAERAAKKVVEKAKRDLFGSAEDEAKEPTEKESALAAKEREAAERRAAAERQAALEQSARAEAARREEVRWCAVEVECEVDDELAALKRKLGKP